MPKKKIFNSKAIFLSDKVRLQLQLIPQYPCTLVEAPIGYGKTTAVRECLVNTTYCVFWQKVFSESVSGFWLAFCRQFRELDALQAEYLRQLGFPGDSTTKEKALDLIQSVLPPSGVIWVIDDYHLVDCPEVAGLIEYLLWNELPNLHIVLTARYTHFINLDEMALKGYVNHIQKDTLELTQADIVAYYRLCGLSPKDKEVHWLYAYTEGWISALYLLMLSYQAERAFTAPPNITALMEKTVYAPLSDEIKAFLITVCLFDTFTPEQAAHMWQTGGSEKLMEKITGANAFIRWDARSGTYQMHRIFAEFLRGIFEQKTPEEKQCLYRRAAAWYRQIGDYILAMTYYELSQDFEGLLTVLELDQGHSMHNEHKESLIAYMESCPAPLRRVHPVALLIYAICLFSYNETERFSATCAELSGILYGGALDKETVRALSGEFEVLLSFGDYNDIEKMVAHYQRAAELLDRPVAFLDTRGGWTFGSPSVLYMFHRAPGLLDNEVKLLREGILLYDRFAKGHGRGAELVMEAERDYLRGDFGSAEIAVHKALHLAGGSKQEDILLCAVFLQARIAFCRGDYALAAYSLKNLREDLERGGWYNLMHTMELCNAWIQLSLGRKQDIPQWILEGDFFSSRMYFPAMGMFHIVYGRALLVCGEYAKLLGNLDYFLETATAFPNLLSQIYAHIYAAAANEKLHRRNAALEELRQALALALPDGLLMPFVENSDLLTPVLEGLSHSGEYRNAISVILKLYAPYHQAVLEMTQDYFTEKRPELTEREMEIARLVSQGLSNSEIGTRLFITNNTVKTMMKRIFEKLGIRSREMLRQYIQSRE
ncbi:LuxR C-terminal-related transcriptional regulator [Oscillibacter sp.]|uniref:LuxR C-terminal-related transcriptional regulator n=1 Tax=Oscillibacter sp. TaxID=1945593 RepID=UPI0033933D06